MGHCSVDIETYSEENLKGGMYRYAEHPSTEIQCVCYSFDYGPVHLWVPREDVPEDALPDNIDGDIHVSLECPFDLASWIEDGGECRAWNAQFERTLMNSHAGKAIGIPRAGIEQWVCTAAKGATMSIPRALGNAAKAVGTALKDEDGKTTMMALAKPRTGKVKRYSIEEFPQRYKILYGYCADDVRAESALDQYLPAMSPGETRAFHLDQRINERGVKVDQAAVANAMHLVSNYRAILEKKCKEWTGFTPGQTAKLSEWIRAEGYDIPNLQAPTLKLAVADPDCPPQVKRIIRLRMLHAMKAVDKYPAIQRAVTADGRLHGMFLYHGAGTGRWSSLIVQLQNLFRPHKDVDANEAIDAFTLRDINWINDMFKPDPMITLASCVRGMLVPEKGKDLLALDYAQIEARVIAWLAGQDDLIEVFISGRDVYKHAAAGIFGVKYEDVTDDQRFIGKVAVLALGYQGGKVAFAKMAKTYGADIGENQADGIKNDWRATNRKIVQLWYNLEEAAVQAVANPGKVYQVSGKKIMFKVEGDFLYMRLPSGRRLAYLHPRLNGDGQVTYMGIDTYTRQWCRCKTYGGKLAENAVQAIARDLLLAGMFKLEEAGYEIVGTVHDEVITEIPESFGSLDEASQLMCSLPEWAEGIPVEAEGFREKRYRK